MIATLTSILNAYARADRPRLSGRTVPLLVAQTYPWAELDDTSMLRNLGRVRAGQAEGVILVGTAMCTVCGLDNLSTFLRHGYFNRAVLHCVLCAQRKVKACDRSNWVCDVWLSIFCILCVLR